MHVFQKGNGLHLLDTFRNTPYDYKNSILYFFDLFDQREDFLNETRVIKDVQIVLSKKKPPTHNTKPKNYHPKKRFSTYHSNDEEWVKKYAEDDCEYVKKN